MIVTKTTTVEGRPIVEYLDIVVGEAVLGAGLWADLAGSIRYFTGGRFEEVSKNLKDIREAALQEMQEQAATLQADAIIGVDIKYNRIGNQGGMVLISATGTAVKL